jgi:PAS domain S-box-containing protein
MGDALALAGWRSRRRNPGGMKRRALINAALILALAILASFGWVAYREIAAARKSARWENHTYLVMRELNQLLSAMDDAETGQRGFIITGNEDYLQPYTEALTNVHQRLASLRSLTKDNPRQQKQLDAIEPTIRAKLAELKETVELRSTAGFEAAQHVLATGRGKALMDELRRRVAEAQAEEARLLKERTRVTEATTGKTLRALSAGGFLAFALLLTSFVLLKRQIAGRRQAETALRSSEVRYRRLFEAAHDGVLLVDSQTHKILDANPFMTHLLGYSREELLGQEPWQFGLPKDATAHQAAWQQLQQEGYVRHENLPLQTKSGQPREVEFVSNVYEEDGHSVIQCNIRDVTERKQMEQARAALLVREAAARQEAQAAAALRESQARLNAIISSAMDAVITIDSKQRIVLFNPAAEKMFGVGATEALGEHINRFIPERFRQAHARHVEDFSKSGVSSRRMGRLGALAALRGDGQEFPIEASLSQTEVGNEKLFTVILRDITQRKRAEDELRQSGERFRTMADAIPQLAWIARPDGHIFWYNRRCYEYTGSTLEQMEGWGWQSVADPQVLPKVLEQWGRSIATGQPFDMEFPLRGADGRFRQFLTRVMPLKDNAGQVVLWFGTNTDIAELKQAQEELCQSEERFRALVMASSDVVYRMSPDWSEMRQLSGRDFIADTQAPSRAWLQEYLYPEDQPHVMAVINEAIRTKSIFELEHRVRRVDGTIGWTFSRAIPLQDANGEIVEWFGAASDVTKRKQAEEALRQNEEQFHTLADSIPNLAWWANGDGYITWYNRRWYEYTGTTPEQMEGWGWQSVHDPQVLPKVLEQWRRSIASGQLFDMEFPLRGADGRFRPFLTRIMPLKDHEGRVVRWFGTNTDITEQKQTQARLAAIVESSEDAIAGLELDGIVSSWNRAAERLYGYRAEEIIGQPIALIIPPDRHGEETRILERLRQGEHSDPYEAVRVTRDGRRLDVLVTLSPVRDPAGRMVGASKIIHDITARKQAEEALRESEQRLRLALEVSALGHYERDLVANKAMFDPQCAAIVGLPAGCSDPEAARHSLYPEDREWVLADLARAFDPRLREICAGEFRIVRPDGQVRWVAGRGRVLFDDGANPPQPLKFLGVLQDITARKLAEERQASLLAKVQAANRELNDFAAIVSHDLKTPLRGVATLAKWLQSDYADKLDQEGREHLAGMVNRTTRMDRMIEDILQYSRLGRAKEKLEPVELAELVPAVVQDLAPPAQVRVRIAPRLPVVQGDPLRLRQLFQNLIGNAIKHANKPQVDIQVCWADVGSLWQFSVTDNGPGIEQRHFERIFMIFQTLASKDKTDSTGVGLALVKRIVERAGGRVWVESRPGEGSTFHFTWPKRPRAGATETVERMAA